MEIERTVLGMTHCSTRMLDIANILGGLKQLQEPSIGRGWAPETTARSCQLRLEMERGLVFSPHSFSLFSIAPSERQAEGGQTWTYAKESRSRITRGEKRRGLRSDRLPEEKRWFRNLAPVRCPNQGALNCKSAACKRTLSPRCRL